MDTMIELPAMRRSAELAPNTADADSRTVEVVWSAGARVRRATFFGEPYDEELEQIPPDQEIAAVTADGAYDTRRCYNVIAARGAAAIIPPRKNAQLWKPTTAGAIARNEAVRA